MIEKFSLYSPQMEREIPLHIHVPDDYENSEERYPVLYMFDGHNLFFDEEATFGKSWDLEEFTRNFGKDVIIVGMECDHRPGMRLQEYCPYPLENTFFGPSSGAGKDFFEWIVNDLKPVIDARYRTWPHREATGIAGSSMGGLMAAYGVIAHNDVFSKAGAISPSLVICRKEYLDQIEGTSLDPDTKIYFSFGENELPADRIQGTWNELEQLARFLGQRQVDTRLRLQQGGGHNEQSWSELNPEWMGYLWKDE